MSSAPPSRHWKSPTAIATRYDDIFGVVENVSVWRPAPGPGVSEMHAAVGDRRVAAVDRQRDRERRLERRLVEARKRAARVGRLELRDGVVAAVRLAQVEAAQLVVEDAGVADVDFGRARRQSASATVSVAVWLRPFERDAWRVCVDAAGVDRRPRETAMSSALQDDAARRLRQLDADGLGALESRAAPDRRRTRGRSARERRCRQALGAGRRSAPAGERRRQGAVAA